MAVLGMRGTGTFSNVERPQNWRQGILLYFPNGDAPLTAFMSKLKDQPTDDPQYHWFEKGLPIQRGTIRGAGAADAPADDATIAAGGTADAYLKMYPDGTNANDVSIYKVGHVVFNQIFRTPLSLTRTARKTRLRYDDEGPYCEAKREALQIHSIELEKAFLFGEREEIISLTSASGPLDITSQGQPLRTTRGFLNWLPAVTTTAMSVNTDLSQFNPPGSLTEKLWDQFSEV